MRFLPLPVALKGNDEDNEFLKGGGDKNSSETSDSAQQSHSGFVQAAAVQAMLQQEDPNDSAPRKNKTKPKEEKVISKWDINHFLAFTLYFSSSCLMKWQVSQHAHVNWEVHIVNLNNLKQIPGIPTSLATNL